MACCFNSPHSQRRYRDPADLDEEFVPYRHFGQFRAGSNLVPDDIDGLPSATLAEHLAANGDVILYEAEIDHGKGYRWFRLAYFLLFTPWGLAYLIARGILNSWGLCMCDEVFCWVRKEYSTRTFYRVYSNRIEINEPGSRVFGMLGCGSWNADAILTHNFDRGAFGFSRVNIGIVEHLCFIWPLYGGVVARHRCQCNGPVWNRWFTDCGAWWCDEWLCQVCLCTYRYRGLANADEAAFASSIALQAFFEGRPITPEDMKNCLAYWRENISEETDPIGRKRPVCCEPHCIPWPSGQHLYRCMHPPRNIPYGEDKITDEIREVYDRYEAERTQQIESYVNFRGPAHNSTVCRKLGCRRFFGRKGCIFCTEGCSPCNCDRKRGDPASPLEEHDLDDDWDASTVLMKVMGPPPPNVVIRRWRWDPERAENVLETHPEDYSGEVPLLAVASVKKEQDAVGSVKKAQDDSAESEESPEVDTVKKPHDS